MTRVITGLAQLADRYDVLLCDVWGVIHNGRESFPRACAALAQWGHDVGPVVLISNSPRPSHDVIPQLDGLAVPRDSWSALVTSGDATRALLADRAPGPAWALGPDRDAPLYEGLGLQFAEPDRAAFISCTGPYDDEVETPEDYRDRFEACVARDLEMICANPDIVVQRGSRLIYCAGALAEFYAALGGRTIMAGKPWSPIYDLALDQAERLLGRPLDQARVLAVGDGIATDVRGANNLGLDVLFVAAGIHQAELAGANGLDPGAVDARLAADAVQAAYAIADLDW